MLKDCHPSKEWVSPPKYESGFNIIMNTLYCIKMKSKYPPSFRRHKNKIVEQPPSIPDFENNNSEISPG